MIPLRSRTRQPGLFPAPNSSSRVGVCLVLLVLSGSVAAQDRVLRVHNTAAQPALSGQFNVELSRLQDFAGGDFTLGFDPHLISIDDVNKTPATSDLLLLFSQPVAGLLSISMAGAEGLTGSASDVIFTVDYTVAAGASSGETSLLQVLTAHWYDIYSAPYSVWGSNGILLVGSQPLLQENLQVQVSSASAAPGELVTLSLNLNFAGGASLLDSQLTWPEAALEWEALRISLSGWQGSAVPASDGVEISFEGTEEISDIGPLSLAEIDLRVGASEIGGTELEVMFSDLLVQNDEGLAYWAVTTPALVTVTGSGVTPTPSSTSQLSPTPSPTPTETPVQNLPGDFNADGVVNQLDLLLMLSEWETQEPAP